MTVSKFASSDVLAVMGAAGPTMRALSAEVQKLAAENRQLRADLGRRDLVDRVEKLAHEMVAKDLTQGSFEDAKTFLLEKAATGELPTWESAVKLSARKFELGAPGSSHMSGGNTLERFLLEGED